MTLALAGNENQCGNTIPLKKANPNTNRFLELFKSTNWRLDKPTATMSPNKHQNIPPTIGFGIKVNIAPNFPRMDKMIINNPPICMTLRLAT